MIEYKVEKLVDCLEEIRPLVEDHHEEVDMYKDKIKVNPDYDKYFAMEGLGIVHIVTARDDGKLIGYLISFVTPHIHYSDHKYATNDLIFIDASYRKTKTGFEMLKFAEESLKGEGVDVINITMKASHPFDSLCEGLGYTYSEKSYSKYIGV